METLIIILIPVLLLDYLFGAIACGIIFHPPGYADELRKRIKRNRKAISKYQEFINYSTLCEE